MRRYFVLLLSLPFLFCTNNVNAPGTSGFSMKYQTGPGMFTMALIFNDTIKSIAKSYCHRPDTAISFILSDSELTLIKNRINEISFFSYPDTFRVHQTDSIQIITMPAQVYSLKIQTSDEIGSVYWNSSDFHDQNDSSAVRLKSLFDLLDGIITNNNQYHALPADDCLYL